MWAAAADTTVGTSPSDALIVSIFTFLGVVATAIATIVVAAIKSKGERTTPSPPAPTVDPGEMAVIKYQLNEHAEDFDVLDRTVQAVLGDADDVVRFLNREFPGWRP